MAPPDRPLRLGEIFAETIHIYRDRLWASLGLGAVASGGWILGYLTGNVILFVLVGAVAFTASYAAAARLVAGDSFGEAWAAVGRGAPALLVLTLVVGVPFVLGRVDVLILLFAVLWQAFIGFAVPVAAIESAEKPSSATGLGPVLLRAVLLARAEFLHALGVVCALILVYLVFGALIGQTLVGLADNSGVAASFLVNIVLAPFFFLGLSVLYFEQRTRVSRPAEPRRDAA